MSDYSSTYPHFINVLPDGAIDFILEKNTYSKISNISHTQSPNINVSHLVLQLSVPNPLKPGVKLRMKM